MEFLKPHINRSGMRGYFMEKVNKPLEKAIVILGNRYPEPTKLSCIYPNSHRLLDIRDKFFEYENNRLKRALFSVLFKILIVKYEHSPYYSGRFDWFIEEINKSGWKQRALNHPTQCWKEPVPYGRIR